MACLESGSEAESKYRQSHLNTDAKESPMYPVSLAQNRADKLQGE